MRYIGTSLVTLVVLSCATTQVSAQSVRVVRTLPGYQCMSLSQLWNGVGPMPPPVPVYGGPKNSAPKVGIAASTVIVRSPMQVDNGRTPILQPNGHVAWIGVNDIAPWHVVSNPNARCYPALLSNGLYGTTSNQ
jgi:hypothetical protein